MAKTYQQEPVYWEFLQEFYATISFDLMKTPDDRTTVSFRLGGVSRECSAIEFSVRVGVYTFDKTRIVHFPKFLVDCVIGQPND